MEVERLREENRCCFRMYEDRHPSILNAITSVAFRIQSVIHDTRLISPYIIGNAC